MGTQRETPLAASDGCAFIGHGHVSSGRLQQYIAGVKHADDSALDDLEGLLAKLRGIGELVERRRGCFYRRSRAFLHFHMHPAGLFADVRLDPTDGFERVRVSTKTEQKQLLASIAGALAE